jgi:hypothetical protein
VLVKRQVRTFVLQYLSNLRSAVCDDLQEVAHRLARLLRSLLSLLYVGGSSWRVLDREIDISEISVPPTNVNRNAPAKVSRFSVAGSWAGPGRLVGCTQGVRGMFRWSGGRALLPAHCHRL